MNRIIAAIAAGILSLSAAACSTPAEQAIGGVAMGSLAGAGFGGAMPDRTVDAPPGEVTTANVSEPDYGAKKPHDHCGNGTMVHLGSVICSP
ncbi:hypothetical protein [Shinella sp. M27]|uniref:hypothetical protein n=1 Tax=Shinella sp. M27 TaxID=3368614 RepID=UPI003B9E4948